MTESLADGPEWQSQILISFWSITLLRCRHVKRFLNSFPQSMNSTGAILLDKELMKMQVDLQKTFPDIPDVSQMSGSPSLRRGDTNKGLNNPSGIGCLGE